MAKLDTSGLDPKPADPNASHTKLVRNLIIGAAVVVGAAVIIWLLIQRGQSQQQAAATAAAGSSGGSSGTSNPPSPSDFPRMPPVPAPLPRNPGGVPVFRPMPAQPVTRPVVPTGPSGPAQPVPGSAPGFERMPPSPVPGSAPGFERMPPSPVAPPGSHPFPEMPPSHEPPLGQPRERTVVVKPYPEPGSTLTGISQQFYGTQARWAEIWSANRAIIGSDPNRLTPGTMLTIPA